MGNNTLNDIKAYLYITEPEPDFTEFLKKDSIKLEYLEYKCSRERDYLGVPFGSTKETILTFASFCMSGKLDQLYDKIYENSECTASVVFNPCYGEDDRLKYFTRAFTAKGYVINTNELAGYDENMVNKKILDNVITVTPSYKSQQPNNIMADSITMIVKFLVNELRYFNEGSVGLNSNNTLYINY